MSDSDTTWSPGNNIGPYRVVALLGAGGMGQVFRAHDSKLNRDVALKVLPGAVAADPARLARFTREAHVLASLNHPHIAAIYGLEESTGHPALVLELVEGQTLAQLIAGGPIAASEALRIARQIADALQAAHEKGVVHRDLKPANIKITPQGAVKVLDFGLAKTTAAELPIDDASHAPTVIDATRVGTVLGTAAYMSPEQARGLPMDARTDIWAFGCVVFEMLTGRKAFGGDSASDSMTRILELEPDWQALPKSLPVRARELLRQCLRKDPHERLASMALARTALDELLAPTRSWPRSARLGLGVAAVVVLAVAGYAWSHRGGSPITSMADWTQLTRLDSVTQPALSPDGRLLAFIRGTSTFETVGDVYIKLLPDGEPVPLTHDASPKMSPAFSPDGNRITYTVHEGDTWDTWDVATLRGEPRLRFRNAAGLSWISPRGLLFSEIKSGQHMAIVQSSDTRSDARDVYLPTHESAMAHRSFPSADGKQALVVEMDALGAWIPCRLVPIAGGPSRQVGPPNGRCTYAAWSPDGRWMYFSADVGTGFHLWRQRSTGGEPEQMTFGATEEEGIAVAPDGRSLITSVGLTQRSVWLHDRVNERQISLEGYAYFPLISSDGQKVCFRVTNASGSGQSPSELWMYDVPSGRADRLFPGQLVTGYDLSKDDRVVAAVPGGDGQTHLWLASLDARERPHMIPDVIGDAPKFGRTGEIVFRLTTGEKFFVSRVPEAGGEPHQIGEITGNVLGTVSPDGEWITGMGPDNAMTLFPFGAQSPVPIVRGVARVRWTADGRRAYVSFQRGSAAAFAVGRTYVVPLPNGRSLPDIPPGGFGSEADLAALPGVEVLPHGDIALGSSPDVYVYSRLTTTRNLYRIPLRD